MTQAKVNSNIFRLKRKYIKLKGSYKIVVYKIICDEKTPQGRMRIIKEFTGFNSLTDAKDFAKELPAKLRKWSFYFVPCYDISDTLEITDDDQEDLDYCRKILEENKRHYD